MKPIDLVIRRKDETSESKKVRLAGSSDDFSVSYALVLSGTPKDVDKVLTTLGVANVKDACEAQLKPSSQTKIEAEPKVRKLTQGLTGVKPLKPLKKAKKGGA